MVRYEPGNVLTEQLQAEQTLGFAVLLLYFEQVKKEVGEKRALELLERTAIQRRKSWFENIRHSSHGSTSRDVLQEATELLKMYWKEVNPMLVGKEIQVQQTGASSVQIEYGAWCPFCEAAKKMNLDQKKICYILGLKPSQWMIEQLSPRLEITQTISKDGIHHERLVLT
jgi:hypothetical protein